MHQLLDLPLPRKRRSYEVALHSHLVFLAIDATLGCCSSSERSKQPSPSNPFVVARTRRQRPLEGIHVCSCSHKQLLEEARRSRYSFEWISLPHAIPSVLFTYRTLISRSVQQRVLQEHET